MATNSILQVVDIFYASLQIRCTAHNLQMQQKKELAGFMPILLLFTPLLKSCFFGFYVNGAILINGGTHAPAYIILHNHL